MWPSNRGELGRAGRPCTPLPRDYGFDPLRRRPGVSEPRGAPFDRERLGSLDGLRVLHLQCQHRHRHASPWARARARVRSWVLISPSPALAEGPPAGRGRGATDIRYVQGRRLRRARGDRRRLSTWSTTGVGRTLLAARHQALGPRTVRSLLRPPAAGLFIREGHPVLWVARLRPPGRPDRAAHHLLRAAGAVGLRRARHLRQPPTTSFVATVTHEWKPRPRARSSPRCSRPA